MKVGGFSLGAVISVVLSAVALALCAGRDKDLVAFAAAFSLGTSVLILVQSRRWVVPEAVCIVNALTCLSMCILLMQDFEFIKSMGELEGAHVEGLMYWLITFPTAFLLLSAVVNISGAGFNRYVAPVFVAFFSIAIATMSWIYVSMACAAQLDIVYTQSMEEAYLFINCIMSAAGAFGMTYALKGKGYRMERREVPE